MNEWTALVLGGVGAPLMVAACLGLTKWATAVTRMLAKVTELANEMGELATAFRDTLRDVSDVRSELAAHQRIADDRWASLGGIIPHPRYITADDRPPRPVVVDG